MYLIPGIHLHVSRPSLCSHQLYTHIYVYSIQFEVWYWPNIVCFFPPVEIRINTISPIMWLLSIRIPLYHHATCPTWRVDLSTRTELSGGKKILRDMASDHVSIIQLNISFLSNILFYKHFLNYSVAFPTIYNPSQTLFYLVNYI